MFNRKERRDRSCEHVAPTESAGTIEIGMMICGRCHDYFGTVIAQAHGLTRVVGVQCLNCEIAMPVDSLGNLPSPMTGGAA